MLVRNNASIFWIAVLLASAAWWIPGAHMKIVVSLVSILVVVFGALVALKPLTGTASLKQKYVLPLAALTIALASLLSVL